MRIEKIKSHNKQFNKKPLTSSEQLVHKLNMRLFKRGKWWHVEFYRGKSKSLRTQDEDKAKKLFKEIEKQWLRGRLFQLDSERRITLAEFTKEYLAYRQNIVSKDTYNQDKLALKLLADALGGNIALRAIKPKRMEEFKSICLARGVKPVSVNSYLRHIKCAFGVAEEWYKNFKRPKIKMCKLGKKLPRALAKKDIDKLLKKAKQSNVDLYRLIMFYLWTGCRRSEALQLQWQDVQLDREKPFCKVTGKGDKERIIPLLPPVVELLRSFRKDIGPVFIKIHPDTISHWFQGLTRSCGIKARLHDLRHSAVTYMLASGIRIEVVKQIVGHAQISTTMIYVDVLEEMLYSEMEKLRFE